MQVWNFNSPDYLKEEIERIQKRALRIICPNLSYREALEASEIRYSPNDETTYVNLILRNFLIRKIS